MSDKKTRVFTGTCCFLGDSEIGCRRERLIQTHSEFGVGQNPSKSTSIKQSSRCKLIPNDYVISGYSLEAVAIDVESWIYKVEKNKRFL
jgi:hypothetical protein